MNKTSPDNFHMSPQSLAYVLKNAKRDAETIEAVHSTAEFHSLDSDLDEEEVKQYKAISRVAFIRSDEDHAMNKALLQSDMECYMELIKGYEQADKLRPTHKWVRVPLDSTLEET
jgi:hypothetical protein